ncbi:MAG: hypothetical protein ACJ8JD_07210 [Chthoniobacterales bacterium]
MSGPIICFGQQPSGFFPKRYLYAKIVTARRLQKEIGGDIVFFYHDADHDARETITLVKDRNSGREQALNFQFANKIQKQFSPLYAKHLTPEWHAKTTRQLPCYVQRDLVDSFAAVETTNVSEFCLQMYEKMGLLGGIRVARSSDRELRKQAVAIDDFFVDVTWQGELVRARFRDSKLLLHEGGNKFIELPAQDFEPAQVSPTRDTRLRWMQSVIHCTHYVHGAGERQYLNESDAPEITYIAREAISESDKAWIGE